MRPSLKAITLAVILIITILETSQGFTTSLPAPSTSSLSSSSSLYASSKSKYASPNRSKILRRKGEHFDLNRFSGRVEFGYTASLVTSLPNSDPSSIDEWLSDERRVAMSIWDEKLMKELGDGKYRLQLMPLQFVTIRLSPTVDNYMWTEVDSNGQSMFQLQSVDFDPNIEILPGINIPPSSLGIDIEVVGELYPNKNGKGVEGKIGFVSSGNLTPPMRLLPEPALKSASNVICKTISDFAIRSFQKGAREKYEQFRTNKS